MNKDKLKGAAREAKGAVQSAAGGAANDRSTQFKGEANKAAGKLQRKFGEAKDAAD